MIMGALAAAAVAIAYNQSTTESPLSYSNYAYNKYSYAPESYNS